MKKRIVLGFYCILILFFIVGCKLNEELEVLEFDYDSNNESYEFQWSADNDPYLEQLLVEFNLNGLVAGSKSELEKVIKVTNWVNNLWDHDGNNEPQNPDPISILREVKNGQNFRCVEYSIVINGSLNALGIPSRLVGLKTKDVETRKSGAGHVVVEAYLSDIDKWIFIDGQWNVIPVLKGIPLDGVELQRALVENRSEIELLSYSNVKNRRYLNWIAEYLYYFDVNLDNRVIRQSNTGLMLVPKGAKAPEVFQVKWPIEDMIYTNSINAFYAKP